MFHINPFKEESLKRNIHRQFLRTLKPVIKSLTLAVLQQRVPGLSNWLSKRVMLGGGGGGNGGGSCGSSGGWW